MVLAYLCATTQNLKSGSGLPVLLNGPARGGGPAKHIGTSASLCRPSYARAATDQTASAPSLQLAVDMLSDLADGVQDVASGYDEAVERDLNGSTRDSEDNNGSTALITKSSLLFSKS